MSIRLIDLVLDAPLEGTTKLVMVALADCANDAGVCWPSIDRLAIRASTSRRNVSRILAGLEQSGHVSRKHRGRAGTTVFQINIDSVQSIIKKVTPSAPFIEKKGDTQRTFYTERVTPRDIKGDTQRTQTVRNLESKDSPPLFAPSSSAPLSGSTPAPKPKPPTRRQPRAKKQANLSEHAWLTRWWCWVFAELTGGPYAFNQKAAGIIAGLLRDVGFDETLERACVYLLLPEQRRFPKGGAPTLEGLRAMVNQLSGKFDEELEVKAVRAGIFPGEDVIYLYGWKPWEAA